MADFKFELHSPITEEEWDLITDVDLDHTPSVMFHTKHGKDVEYIKVKHGRWLPSDKGDCMYACSECGFVRDAYILEEKAYCPRCGSDMR